MRLILTAALIALFAASCVTPAAQRFGRVPSSGGSSGEEAEKVEESEDSEEAEEAEESEESEESEEDREVDDSKPF